MFSANTPIAYSDWEEGLMCPGCIEQKYPYNRLPDLLSKGDIEGHCYDEVHSLAMCSECNELLGGEQD